MSEFVEQTLQPYFNYWIYVILMMIGLFAMIAKKNLIKKLIGMSIFQTAIILFYVSIGVKEGATIPILSSEQVHGAHAHGHEKGHVEHHDGDDGAQAAAAEVEPNKGDHGKAHADLPAIDARRYDNPIPHVLMLTAIVVGVGTLGLALAIAQRVHSHYGSLEEDEILKQIQSRTNG